MSQLKFLFLTFFACSLSLGYSQTQESMVKLDWKQTEIIDPITLKKQVYISVPEWVSYSNHYKLPQLTINLEAGNQAAFKIKISETIYEPFDQKLLTLYPESSKYIQAQNADQPSVETITSREINYTLVRFFPFKLNTSTKQYERLVSFKIQSEKVQKFQSNLRAVSWKNHSVLSSGKFVNIRIKKAGIYKIDKALFEKMGFSTAGLDPRTIKLYGMGGGMLPQNSAFNFYNDPEEMSIQIIGEQDGTFDDGDYILFYHRGPHTWNYNGNQKTFEHQYNIYSEESGVYISTSNGAGKRMNMIDKSSGTGNKIVTSFDELYFHEKDLVNLEKSGRVWYGEEFDKVVEKTFDIKIPDAVNGDTFIINTDVAGRTFERTNSPSFYLYINGNAIDRLPITWTTPTYGDPYMIPTYSSKTFIGSSNLNISLQYEKSGDFNAMGWLNYIEVIGRRQLNYNGSTMFFRDSRSLGNSSVKYIISQAAGKKLLDITDPVHPSMITGKTDGNNQEIYDDNTSLKEYAVYDNDFLIPETFYNTGNQDLHAATPVDMVILTHTSFKSEVEQYATYKRNNGLRVLVIEPQAIYNEFSCGVQDITAIRNFMKMLYDKAASVQDKPKYLLIFGDGSYDFKDRIKGNTNFIPTYESFDSYTSSSFCNDEYYGTLDDGEGYLSDYKAEGLDVAVGRVPVESSTEAAQMVSKLMHYNTVESFGDWRQYITIIGDDGDNNTHQSQADKVSGYIQNAEPGLNINKLYLDAYEKKIVDGVPAYPDVHDELIRQLDRGCLIVNYSGHGGPYQWAHEKVFDITDIENLKNYNHLPIFMAATCDFGPFDNPELRSAGEKLMLSTKGGAIAYLGTSRIANTGQNEPFNGGLFVNNMFQIKNGKYPTIGEAYLKLKASGSVPDALRNFYLMGDPSMDLGLPINKVQTTHIKSKPVNTAGDTIRALELVTISGEITDINNQLISDFNGTVFPTVFDKAVTYKTLGNDPGSPTTNFTQQKNSIFRGSASVVNGKFTFSFVVPKDINYQWGPAKISYYAFDNNYQAKGYYNKIILGGTDDTTYADNQGPEINIYLNDEKFAYGGMTNQNPLLLLKLKDASGINSVGTGVGRNITATLDGEKTYIVNEYYQSDKDNYTKGSVRYQLVDIADGKHTLKVKAWDVLNNSNESITEFVVAQDATLIIRNILNYPNPFTTKTAFHFDHNKPGELLNVQVQIMSITGQIIKNLFLDLQADGSHFDNIDWDGRDDFGDKIGKGVYLYQIRVKTSSGEIATERGKLVILQ